MASGLMMTRSLILNNGGENRVLVFCAMRNGDGGGCRRSKRKWLTSHKIFLHTPRIDAAGVAVAITVSGICEMQNGDRPNPPRSPGIVYCQLRCSSRSSGTYVFHQWRLCLGSPSTGEYMPLIDCCGRLTHLSPLVDMQMSVLHWLLQFCHL